MSASLYLCLHLRDFSAQSLSASRAELRAQPVAVLGGEPPLERVFSITRHACRLGVREGMSRVQAESFGIALLRRDRNIEDHAFAQLLQCAQKFSPRVETVASPQDEHCGATLMLDVSGSERLLGSATEIASALLRSVSALGFEASVASARKAPAALLAARGNEGVTTIAPGNEAEALAPLPLSVLEPDAVAALTFESWGIHTLRELAALPAKSLAARLGQNGLHMQRMARGESETLFIPSADAIDAPLTESVELEHPVELLEPLLFLISQMLESVLRRAGERSLALAEVETVLLLDGPSTDAPREHRRVVHPTLPERERLTLLKLVQLDFEAHPPAAAVIALRMTARPAKAQVAQHGLFAAQAPEAGHMAVLLARLRKLVGEGRVGSPELIDSHEPESFRVAEFAPQSARPAARASQIVSALRMVRPPKVVKVKLRDSAPAELSYEGCATRLQRVSGPWRSSGAWWTHPAWSREEWDVELNEQSRRCLRLAFDPGAQCWFVIGVYD